MAEVVEISKGDHVEWFGLPEIWGTSDRRLRGKVLEVAKPGIDGVLQVESEGGFLGLVRISELCGVVKQD